MSLVKLGGGVGLVVTALKDDVTHIWVSEELSRRGSIEDYIKQVEASTAMAKAMGQLKWMSDQFYEEFFVGNRLVLRGGAFCEG